LENVFEKTDHNNLYSCVLPITLTYNFICLHGSQNWSLAINNEYILRVFENKTEDEIRGARGCGKVAVSLVGLTQCELVGRHKRFEEIFWLNLQP
jgi:hypothetical protein